MNIFSEPTVPQVTVDDVKTALDKQEQCVLLDVRTPGEYERARIKGSVNVPLDRIDCDISQIISDTSTKVYVYCLSGSRSVHAVDVMRRLGYTRVFDMEHGLLAWRAKYYPVED